eukprot:320141-Chlamydomonas_euryale.AAC.2
MGERSRVRTRPHTSFGHETRTAHGREVTRRTRPHTSLTKDSTHPQPPTASQPASLLEDGHQATHGQPFPPFPFTCLCTLA